MRTLGIDVETYSDRDIQEAGAYAYADSPAFELLLIGYSFGTSESTHVIDLSELDLFGTENTPEKQEMIRDYIQMCYPEFWEALMDPNTLKTAYNANFERTTLAAGLGISCPPDEWQCTAVLASTLGLPRSLAEVGRALKLPQDKQKDSIGKQLINYFCKPCKATKANSGRTRNLPIHDMDKWKLFVRYNRQDVIAEQAILRKISKYPMTEAERRLWEFDQRMNDRGVLVDADMVRKIITYDDKRRQELMEEAQELTHLDNPNSLAQLKGWFLSEYGLEIASLTKDTIGRLMEDLDKLDTDTRAGKRVLEIRQALGKTSTAKYQAMMNALCKDDRIRGVLVFYGANRTGRWAGRIVQLHNLPQNKIPDIELARELAAEGDFESMELLFGETSFVFSQLIRTALIAAPDHRFVVSDFSAIEARMISWIAGEEWRLEVFREGKDIYCETASRMFKVPVVKHGINGELRQKGKIAELALGYQGAFGAMKTMDRNGDLTDEEIPGIVDDWRSANPSIVKLWRTCEAAAKTAIREKRKVRINKGITFDYADHVLFIKLPSGRSLAYFDAAVEKDADGREKITYAGVNQERKTWERQDTYGGKLTENIVQAVARDCLACAMLNAEKAGYNIVFHVHDEMIVEVPNSDTDAESIITKLMALSPPWAPDLPLKGETYATPFYKKD